MAKQFNDFNDFFKWTKEVIKKAQKEAIEEVAKEVYIDSKKYVYLDTEEMYESGSNSDFKDGFVLLKAPQVRWLYYTSRIKPRRNTQAVPQWFEITKKENLKKYITVYNDSIKKAKGGK